MGNFDMFNKELGTEMPFSLEKAQNLFSNCEESTHDSQFTSKTTSSSEKRVLSSPSSSSCTDLGDLERDPKINKLLEDLEFID
jgi:hypothetical protein